MSDDFDILHSQMQQGFLATLKSAGENLFYTDAEGLWEVWIGSFAGGERQHHTCNCCRRFIQHWGGLAVIDDNGRQRTALWNDRVSTPPLYAPGIAALAQAVKGASVTGICLPAQANLGRHHEGDWTHLSVRVPRSMVHTSRTETTSAAEAALLEDYRTLRHGAAEIWANTVTQALNLLEGGTLYRAETVKPYVQFLHDLYAKRSANPATHWPGLIWKAVATAPGSVYCRPRSNAASQLLEDIQKGLDTAAIERRFNAQMAPEQFARAQTASTAGNIRVAERLIEKLGLAPALVRRYAFTRELPAFWTPSGIPSKIAEKRAAAGIFDTLVPRERASAPPAQAAPVAPGATMTWEKFQRTVLPDVKRMSVVVPQSSARFAALVTANDPEAPPILNWDREDARNPFSWYYGSGIDADIRRRVTKAGGQIDDVSIRASLIWNNRNDLDLSVVTPSGKRVSFITKFDGFGGYLDVDMNVRGDTDEPVENVRWPRGQAPAGKYIVDVWNYANHVRPVVDTPYRVELEVDGRIFHLSGVVSRHELQRQRTVARFRVDGEGRLIGEPEFTGNVVDEVESRGGIHWGLRAGAVVPVTALVLSPNLWGEPPLTRHGRHVFFMLEGCRDDRPGTGRGFFTETLSPDLHPARRTLEAYNAQAEILGREEADAFGIGMSDQSDWNLLIKVDTPTGQRAYKIDRWD